MKNKLGRPYKLYAILLFLSVAGCQSPQRVMDPDFRHKRTRGFKVNAEAFDSLFHRKPLSGMDIQKGQELFSPLRDRSIYGQSVTLFSGRFLVSFSEASYSNFLKTFNMEEIERDAIHEGMLPSYLEECPWFQYELTEIEHVHTGWFVLEDSEDVDPLRYPLILITMKGKEASKRSAYMAVHSWPREE